LCLAVPAKIVEKSPNGKNGKVDFGDSIKRDVDLSLVDANIGDYVLIHAGFAIEVLDKMEAVKTLQVWEEMLASI
jgi:hydrogenase expression/formation protein HypC